MMKFGASPLLQHGATDQLSCILGAKDLHSIALVPCCDNQTCQLNSSVMGTQALVAAARTDRSATAQRAFAAAAAALARFAPDARVARLLVEAAELYTAPGDGAARLLAGLLCREVARGAGDAFAKHAAQVGVVVALLLQRFLHPVSPCSSTPDATCRHRFCSQNIRMLARSVLDPSLSNVSAPLQLAMSPNGRQACLGPRAQVHL
jgi:hypothetical protein